MTRRIRVLQVTHDLGVGGLPRVVETLCRSIDPERFDVSALCLNFGGELAEMLTADGFTVSVLEQAARKPDYLSSWRVARFLRAGHFDVVHSHNTQPFLDAAIGTLLSDAGVLVHTDHARDFPDKLRYMVLEHLLSWRAFKVVGVSEHTTENLNRYEWIPRRKLATIPNGIDGRLFDRAIDRPAVRASLGVPEGAVVALFASRLEAQKDVPTLLDAFVLLRDRVPALHLVVAGQGSLRESLVARATALGIGDRVHFAGVRLDIPDVLRAADLFVLSSTWEGLPMVILEALAARCPIVSTAVGGVPSAIEDGVSGLLVPPRDPVRLAAGIERAARDPELRRRLAERGRAVFEERFSAAAMARRYEALYEEGCRRRGIA
ncbi:MAG: glycosyltransferase family 4 protein [Gemmatimonadetes bacterium]|nr:glycosyltransferase family 4 protein [Gemmatimonadota bacterium]